MAKDKPRRITADELEAREAEMRSRPVTMTKQGLDFLMFMVQMSGPCSTWGQSGYMSWENYPDDLTEPVDMIEFRYSANGCSVDVYQFDTKALAVVGYCVSHGILVRHGNQIQRDDMRKEEAEAAMKKHAAKRPKEKLN